MEKYTKIPYTEQNLAKKTDSYKVSHWLQFPKDTNQTFYYGMPRASGVTMKPYGLQMIIKKHFFEMPSKEQVAEAAEFWKSHGEPFNIEGWNKISELGYLPLEVKAVPEGLEVPSQNVLYTITNTLPEFFWLPGWMETLIMQSWYPTTVCTISNMCKRVIKKYLEKTGTPEALHFKLHDFGYRGATCEESAEIGGSAHLVNFMGTDTAVGIGAAQRFYNEYKMLGFSIPAAEHSTMTAWLQENEALAYTNMLDQFAKEPNQLVAVVSDSYDLNYAVKEIWGKQLKERVLNSGCTIIVRPDSGDPAKVSAETIRLLADAYGYSLNDKGYLVLNKAVRVIQGDGISSPEEIERILAHITKLGFSTDNLAFGMGGGLLQKCDRDTFKFAMKCSACLVGTAWRDVYKDPVDAPWKKSLAGRLTLVKDKAGQFKTVTLDKVEENEIQLRSVFKDGELLIDESFETIRNR